jgi:hypothetical protein
MTDAYFIPVALRGLVLCLLSSGNALAQASPAAQASQPSPAPKSLVDHPAGIEQQFLRVESSPWSALGLRLSKNGQVVGPRWFSVVPDEAVEGARKAKKHAVHARIFHGLTAGFALAGVGLIIGGVAVADNHGEWTSNARYLAAGGLLAILAEGVCALFREREIMETVNSYNYDLVRGKLGDGAPGQSSR